MVESIVHMYERKLVRTLGTRLQMLNKRYHASGQTVGKLRHLHIEMTASTWTEVVLTTTFSRWCYCALPHQVRPVEIITVGPDRRVFGTIRFFHKKHMHTAIPNI